MKIFLYTFVIDWIYASVSLNSPLKEISNSLGTRGDSADRCSGSPKKRLRIHEPDGGDRIPSPAVVSESEESVNTENEKNVNLDSDVERISENLTVEIKSKMAVTNQSIVFVMEDPSTGTEYIGKYVVDCFRRGLPQDRLDPEPNHLKHEYSLMSTLEGLEITPKAFYLSDATLIDNYGSQKVSAIYPLAHSQVCRERGSHVRMMLMERNGPDMEKFLGWLRLNQSHDREYIEAVMVLSSRIVELVEKFHNAGYIHGDVFQNNIVFRYQKPDYRDYDWRTDPLYIIDLATSVPVETGKELPERVEGNFYRGWNPALLTHWQLNLFRYGRRDDIFRVIESMAYLLSDGEIEKRLNAYMTKIWVEQPQFQTQGDRLARSVANQFKMSANFFSPDPVFKTQCCRNMGLSEGQVSSIQALLERLTIEARRPVTPDTVPQYEVMKFLLHNTITRIVST
jgi:hypothetical protein